MSTTPFLEEYSETVQSFQTWRVFGTRQCQSDQCCMWNGLEPIEEQNSRQTERHNGVLRKLDKRKNSDRRCDDGWHQWVWTFGRLLQGTEYRECFTEHSGTIGGPTTFDFEKSQDSQCHSRQDGQTNGSRSRLINQGCRWSPRRRESRCLDKHAKKDHQKNDTKTKSGTSQT